MEEIWKEIPGYEKYMVSNLGNVKSLDYMHTGNEALLSNVVVGKGKYLKVNLYNDGKRKLTSVHRLVAQAFIPNPKNLPEVNHKDENPANNCVDNLEWCTRKYNNSYGTKNQRCAEKLTNSDKLSKRIYQYSLDGELIKEWPSSKEIWRELGINRSLICRCCRKNTGHKKTHGFIWKYVENN